MNKQIKLSILLAGTLLFVGCGSNSKTTRTAPAGVQQTFKTLADGNTTVNNAPVAYSKTFCTYKDTNLTGQLVACDKDSNTTLTFAVNDLNETKGSIDLNSSTGIFNYVPAEGFVGDYTFTFTANDGIDTSNEANITITVKDKDDVVQVPEAPANLIASDVTTTSAKLTWDDVEGETGYVVYQDGVAIKCVEADTTSLVVEGLEEDKEYTFTVRAKNDAGCSDASDEVKVKTEVSSVAPASPTGLEEVAKNKTCVRLKWVDNSDNESGFEIYQDDKLVKTVPANSTCATVSGLKKGTSYDFKVVAVNKAGSNASEVLTVTTQDGANEAPVAYDRTYSTYKDTNLTSKLCAFDADGDTLIYEVKTDPEHGSVELNATSGEFIYSPENNYTGEDKFTFIASDETNSSEEKTATIKICDK
jgi:hypothetical protein